MVSTNRTVEEEIKRIEQDLSYWKELVTQWKFICESQANTIAQLREELEEK